MPNFKSLFHAICYAVEAINVKNISIFSSQGEGDVLHLQKNAISVPSQPSHYINKRVDLHDKTRQSFTDSAVAWYILSCTYITDQVPRGAGCEVTNSIDSSWIQLNHPILWYKEKPANLRPLLTIPVGFERM